MAPGGKRLGAGRPKKPLIEHLTRGTYRRDRHGELPAHVHQMPMVDDWMPTQEDLDALGPAGRDFVARVLEASKVSSVSEGYTVLEAAHCVDALAQIRAVSTIGKSVAETNMLQRLELSWSKQLAALLSLLRVQS